MDADLAEQAEGRDCGDGVRSSRAHDRVGGNAIHPQAWLSCLAKWRRLRVDSLALKRVGDSAPDSLSPLASRLYPASAALQRRKWWP
jgi:hypothetical protein